MIRSLMVAGLLAAAVVAWQMVSGGAPDGETAAAPAAADAAPVGLPPEPVPAGPAPSAQPAPAELPPGLTAEEARTRRRLMALEAAAEARFAQAVELDGLQGSQVAAPVRYLFDSLSLEPVFDPQQRTEGLVEGLRIAGLSDSNPLARAGFVVGDRLVRLGGQPLVDPAQIAYTITELGSEFEVCAARDGGSYCRTLDLGG